MNKDLKLNLKLPKFSTELLRKWLPYVMSVILVALFLYTALLVKSATTVAAADTPDTAAHAVKPIDHKALNLVNNLLAVPVQPDLSNLGKSDPFGN
jgi:hypothetical protein